MGVYVVTQDQRLLRFDAPHNTTIWLQDFDVAKWKIYYRTCTCTDCTTEAHKHLIAWVHKSTVVSIGFERPIAIEGRMLTYSEKRMLRQIYDWLQKKASKGYLPRKVQVQPLGQLVAMVEKIQ